MLRAGKSRSLRLDASLSATGRARATVSKLGHLLAQAAYVPLPHHRLKRWLEEENSRITVNKPALISGAA